MSGSVEIVLWLHEYKYQALENRLAQAGRDIEKAMQEMLIDLYSECVPFEEQQAIRERIDAEQAEQAAEQLANTTWAAYHVTGHGEDLYFKGFPGRRTGTLFAGESNQHSNAAGEKIYLARRLGEK